MMVYSVYIDDDRTFRLDTGDGLVLPEFDMKEVVLGAFASGVTFKKGVLKNDLGNCFSVLTGVFDGYTIDLFYTIDDNRLLVNDLFIIIKDKDQYYLFGYIDDFCLRRNAFSYFHVPEQQDFYSVVRQIIPDKKQNIFVFGDFLKPTHDDWKQAFSLLRDADKEGFSVADIEFKKSCNSTFGTHQRMFGSSVKGKRVFVGYAVPKDFTTRGSYDVFLGVCNNDGNGILFVLDSSVKEGYLVLCQAERIESAVMADKQKEMKSFIRDVLY